jgi:nickel/cobalt exporter
MENVFATLLTALIDAQRHIYSSLSSYLTNFAADRDTGSLLGILPAGIVFGAVHALTPGHSKSVLASYILGSRLQALRGAGIAGLLSITHVGSAVILALLAAPLVTRTLGSGVGRAPALELLSRGVLVAIGVWLLFRAFRGHRHAHGEGIAVGFVAGLVPCPLTLFAMFLALARDVPEAGLMFALAMMLGVGLTLSGIAVATILARNAVVSLMARHGASVDRLVSAFDALGGVLLIGFAAHEIWQ